MTNFKEAMMHLLDQLRSNPFIEIERDYIGVPVYEDIYNEVLSFHNVQLSKGIFDFYNLMSSCKVEWVCHLEKHSKLKRYNPDDTVINGYIHIRPVEEMLRFDNKLEADSWTRNLDDSEKKELNDFRYFDFNDDYIRVGFIIENSKIDEDKIYFIVQNSTGFSPAGMNFNQYLEKIIRFKGFQGWQFNMFFLSTDNNKRMQFYLDQIFDQRE